MKITFSCSSCRSEFTVDAPLVGRTGHCKKCGQRIVIPAAALAAKPGAAATCRSVPVSAPSLGVRREPSASVISAQPPRSSASTGSPAWLSAISQVGLKPITVERMPVVRREATLNAGNLQEFVPRAYQEDGKNTPLDQRDGVRHLDSVPEP